jgi:hypothetical protein
MIVRRSNRFADPAVLGLGLLGRPDELVADVGVLRQVRVVRGACSRHVCASFSP